MPTKKCVIAPDVALPTGGAPGAFMAVGEPERLIDELVRQGKRELTVIANGTAMPGAGIGRLSTARCAPPGACARLHACASCLRH